MRYGFIIHACFADAQPCPLRPDQVATFHTWRGANAVAFRSSLQVNPDGAPNAYHRVLGPTKRDPGLLHICNGASILERRNGHMVNRYPQIGGNDKEASRTASIACKADFFVLQQQNFPECSTGVCARIFGFYAPARTCGPGRDPECGVPEMARDASGQETPYFVSTTSLVDGSFDVTDPRRYLDSRTIPHFVLPGGENGKFAQRYSIKLGDVALRLHGGRGVFAVFGDGGPAGKLGAASPAAINRLLGKPDSMTSIPGALSEVTTLVLPGTRGRFSEMPPRSARLIAEVGRQALQAAGGLSAYAACPGLGGDPLLATE